MIIIDRRLNPSPKSTSNRKRAFDRAREAVKAAAQKALIDRSIVSADGQTLTIKTGAMEEPTFHRVFDGGERSFILAGNKEYVVGDRILKEQSGKGKGSGGSPDGEGEDEFEWMLTLDEFTQYLFDGLELPSLLKKEMAQTESESLERDGLMQEGAPSQLDLTRSVRRSIGRRIALARPKREEIESLEAEEQTPEILEELKRLRRRMKRVPWIDNTDLSYRRYDVRPTPITRAVLFFLMDVSGSMGPVEKDIAKRFFLLLHTFVKRKYNHVEVVFVRHATEARECDEHQFFYGTESGGTVISSAFALAASIQKARFPTSTYNVFTAYCGDGDNYEHDNPEMEEIITNKILPFNQHVFYVEVGDTSSQAGMFWTQSNGHTWHMMQQMEQHHKNLSNERIMEVDDVYPTFRKLFGAKHA